MLSYVKQQKNRMALERAKTYERLEHPPGEAQVDFTTIQVSRDQQLMTYKLLVVSFPHSNAAFVYPMPAENQECFLEGMKQCFQEMGGVPGRIWFDNLPAAVVHIEKGWRAPAHRGLSAILRSLPNRSRVLQSVQRTRKGERGE
ncbi:hypothetical protein ACFOQM_04555 [Paenibacillus sp. GCM10012307]|uniref:Transposase n=1 Tax=Paenibacillus roseus TaxID=2798579 RepID=A0A934MU00_9BACL|nr:transposase [Paenibacillus roseus]MBJ6360582.1 transposase [Paenibacillus roseus]